MRGRRQAPRVLLPDPWHRGRRRFEPLRRLAAEGKVRLWAERSRRRWWRSPGDYRGLAAALSPHLSALAALPPGELHLHEYRGVPVFACARGEFLRLLLRRRVGEIGPNRDPEILSRILASDRDREDLLLCMAAARDWIDFWHGLLARERPFSHAVIRCSSSIRSRTLHALGQQHGLRVLVVERFPFGDLYCAEEREGPLTSRTLLADPHWYRRLALPEEIGAREELRAEAYRRLTPARDRRQPAQAPIPPPFAHRDDGVVVVLGQPVDDGSLIDAPLPELSAATVYRRLIGGILERTRYSVVFAGDVDLLDEWHARLPPAQQGRLRLLPERSTAALMPYADWVVSLSSSALIWACRAGLKPVQLGCSLLGGKGFTHDLADADAAVAALAEGSLDGRLTLAGYGAFEEFLIRALVVHLVPNDTAAAAQLAPRLACRNHVPTLQEARLGAPGPWLYQKTVDILANPVAALRLWRDDRKASSDQRL